MKCKQCGWENPDNRERCEKCGNVLLRQRPFETSATYDDQRAANTPGSIDYGKVYGNVDPQYGSQPYVGEPYGVQPNGGGVPMGQPYGSQPYVGEPYGVQPNGGGVPGEQPYVSQPYVGDPYVAQPNGGGVPVGQPYGSQPYVGEPYGVQPNGGGVPVGQPYGSQPYTGQPYDRQPSGKDLHAQQQPTSPIYAPPGYGGQPQAQNKVPPQSAPQMSEESYCPECDAALPAGATECPVCHAVIRQESIEVVSVCRDCGTEVTPGQKFCHGCGIRLNVSAWEQPVVADKSAAGIDLAKTVDSARDETYAPASPDGGKDDDTVLAGPLAEDVPRCRLQLVAAEASGSPGRIVECVGEEVDLYRDNTDPANNTIARDMQARLTYADGKWSIEDCSTLRTTYIRPGRKIELCDGDVIVMGNREFIFKSKQADAEI